MKTQYIRTVLPILAATWLMDAAATQTFTWGVYRHPSLSQAFQGNYAAQFATLGQRDLKGHRLGVPFMRDGLATTQLLQALAPLSHTHHITLHPILYVPFTQGGTTDSGRYPDSDTGFKTQGYDRVAPIALRLAAGTHDWELQNELSLRQGFKSGAGTTANDYTTPLAHQWATVSRGISYTMHDVGTCTGRPLRTVADVVCADFGLIPFLEAQGARADRLAHHYYYGGGTSSYRVNAPGGAVDALAEMKRIGRLITISELNAAEIYVPLQGRSYDDAKVPVSLETHIGYLLSRDDANVKGAEFYELYDESGKNAAEFNFGLTKTSVRPKTQMLLATVATCVMSSASEHAALVS